MSETVTQNIYRITFSFFIAYIWVLQYFAFYFKNPNRYPMLFLSIVMTIFYAILCYKKYMSDKMRNDYTPFVFNSITNKIFLLFTICIFLCLLFVSNTSYSTFFMLEHLKIFVLPFHGTEYHQNSNLMFLFHLIICSAILGFFMPLNNIEFQYSKIKRLQKTKNEKIVSILLKVFTISLCIITPPFLFLAIINIADFSISKRIFFLMATSLSVLMASISISFLALVCTYLTIKNNHRRQ
jgi:hypothetical protein